MNGDLISRSALLADIEESVVFSVKNGQPSAEIRGANKITDRIKAAPAVEAVEVVRCKDCKFYQDWGDGNITCRLWTDQWDAAIIPDAFCSHGERRADDASD